MCVCVCGRVHVSSYVGQVRLVVTYNNFIVLVCFLCVVVLGGSRSAFAHPMLEGAQGLG